MKSQPRIGVFKEVRAVKERQGMCISREMRGHPIQNHADALLVQVIDEIHEILRRAVTAGGRKKAGGLIAPGGEKWVFGNREQLHVSEVHLAHVLGQFGRQLTVGQPAVAFLGHPPPGAQMHFVDGHRCVSGLPPFPLLHPRAVAPGIIQIPNDRGGVGRHFVAKSKWVSFFRCMAMIARDNVVLVTSAGANTGHESGPNAALPCGLERSGLAVPVIECADHVHSLGIRRPHSKIRPGHPIDARQVRTHLFISAEVAALAERLNVSRGE